MTDKELQRLIKAWRNWLDKFGGVATERRLFEQLKRADELMRLSLGMPLELRKELADLRVAIFAATKARLMTAKEIEDRIEEFRKWLAENGELAGPSKLLQVMAETDALKRHAAFHGKEARRDVAMLRSSIFYASERAQDRARAQKRTEYAKAKGATA